MKIKYKNKDDVDCLVASYVISDIFTSMGVQSKIESDSSGMYSVVESSGKVINFSDKSGVSREANEGFLKLIMKRRIGEDLENLIYELKDKFLPYLIDLAQYTNHLDGFDFKIKVDNLISAGYDVQLPLFHETSISGAEGILMDGFDISRCEHSEGENLIPKGVFLKKTSRSIGLLGYKEEFRQMIAFPKNNLVEMHFDDRDHLSKYLGENIPEYKEKREHFLDKEDYFDTEFDKISGNNEEKKYRMKQILTEWKDLKNISLPYFRTVAEEHFSKIGVASIHIANDIGGSNSTDASVFFNSEDLFWAGRSIELTNNNEVKMNNKTIYRYARLSLSYMQKTQLHSDLEELDGQYHLLASAHSEIMDKSDLLDAANNALKDLYDSSRRKIIKEIENNSVLTKGQALSALGAASEQIGAFRDQEFCLDPRLITYDDLKDEVNLVDKSGRFEIGFVSDSADITLIKVSFPMTYSNQEDAYKLAKSLKSKIPDLLFYNEEKERLSDLNQAVLEHETLGEYRSVNNIQSVQSELFSYLPPVLDSSMEFDFDGPMPLSDLEKGVMSLRQFVLDNRSQFEKDYVNWEKYVATPYESRKHPVNSYTSSEFTC